MPTLSRNDTIHAELVAAGHGPGSLTTMEYKRLLVKTGLSAPQKLTLYDLYKAAAEKPRLY